MDRSSWGMDEEDRARSSGEMHVQQEGVDGPESQESGDEKVAAGGRPSRQGADEVKLTIGTTDLDSLSVLPPVEKNKRIQVEIKNVSAFVPMLFGQPSLLQRLNPLVRQTKDSSTPKRRQILYNINGCVRPGEVLALMGPSGSGKTSLLSIMGARSQKMMKVEGEVSFNGAKLTKKLKRQVGYVLQDDLLYQSLTVRETLYYAAMLRLPQSMPKEEKQRRIDNVITALGLSACQDTIIGGFFRKGISGGERKRTSIGHELLINPSIMFLDEPTSGLDSTTSMHLLQMLRVLAQGGRAIVTTIHQPSSRLYAQLDKLLLLSQGHIQYYGHAQHAVEWFDRLGYRLPYRVNVADFILDLASGDVSTDEQNGEESRQYLIECAEQYLKKHPMDGFDQSKGGESELTVIRESIEPSFSGSLRSGHDYANGHDTNGLANGHAADGEKATGEAKQKQPPHASVIPLSIKGQHVVTAEALEEGKPRPAGPAVSSSGRNRSLKAVASWLGLSRKWQPEHDVFGELEKEPRWGAPYLEQIRILFVRSLRTRRFETLSNQDVLMFLIIAVLSGLFWLQAGQDDTVVAARNTLGLLFFLCMFLSFRALFVALFTFPEEYKHMLKERASGMYRLSAFYFARQLSDLPMDFAIPTFFIIIVYFMGGLRYNAGAFFGIYGTVLLTMLVAQSLGLVLGSVAMNPKTAQTIATVIMLTIVLTGGFFVTDLPAWIGWFKWLSFIYYALEIMLYLQFDGGNRVIYRCVDPSSADQCTLVNTGSPETTPGCTPVEDLQSSLSLVQNPTSQGDAIRDAFVLLGFLVFFRILLYIVLRRKTSGI